MASTDDAEVAATAKWYRTFLVQILSIAAAPFLIVVAIILGLILYAQAS